uniref:Uncharacterized protein n=1 Tax=Amphimedon queenslandica TaxID=400682 RepID=A0A1X7U7B0_AMPQE
MMVSSCVPLSPVIPQCLQRRIQFLVGESLDQP